ncbi:trans-aconitate 2-methyltransferase, partial [Micromonospora echinofusca]
SRPFHDLLARVPARRPRAVVDLGCGPGHLTVALRDRWPDARITGLDASPEMIEQARTRPGDVAFALGDVRTWQPAPDVDVVVTNAVLQWVPGHTDLLRRWVTALPTGAWLAVQVPGNIDAPSHRAIRQVATDGPWRDDLTGVLRHDPVPDAAGYARLLTDAGCAVDAWETTYVHLLPAPATADHPVLSWLEGTGLRPVRAALGTADGRWDAFRAALADRLAEAYPVQDGQVYFPFRRVFAVARTGARP